MARKKPSQIEPLEEFESIAEKMAHWVSQHLGLVVGAIAAALMTTGGVAAYSNWQKNQREEASEVYSEVLDDYLVAMGAEPGSLVVPELANPQAAERVRAEFTERFEEFAEEHVGTLQAGLAWVAVGDLATQAGNPDAASQAWTAGLEKIPAESPIRGILLGRIALSHENEGRWLEAAEAHAEAGQLTNFPLRHFSMAEAARCFDAAGQPERGIELFQQVEVEAPNLQIPDFVRSRMKELQSAYGNTEKASASSASVETEG
ncbi:tetratricopeptide repeat protein [Myxococcota bacterium]|nr:tetratricopeptide repeat protein [Myxococcota bacterium]